MIIILCDRGVSLAMRVIILQYTTCIKSIQRTLYIYTVFYVSYSSITVRKKEKGRKLKKEKKDMKESGCKASGMSLW